MPFDPNKVAALAYRVTLAILSSEDGVQAVGAIDSATGEQEVIQSASLDWAPPFGLWSSPPADTELIAVPCEAGDAVVGSRVPRPAALADAGTGESALYDANGNLVWMRAGNGIELRTDLDAANGIRLVVAARSQKVTVTDDGGDEKAVALNGDNVLPTEDVVTALASCGWPGDSTTPIGTVSASSTLLEAK